MCIGSLEQEDISECTHTYIHICMCALTYDFWNQKQKAKMFCSKIENTQCTLATTTTTKNK